jgi:hypothetical protein
MARYGVRRLLPVLCLAAGVVRLHPCAAEEVLVVEQDYRITQQDKEGVEAKDIRQKMYLSRDWIRIDEFSGPSKQPAETYLIDFKKKQIVNLDNEDLTKTIESFDRRRERIEERKRKVRDDLDNLPPGPQKDKTAQLYRAMLDDDRSFRLIQDKKAEKKAIAEVECAPVRIEAENDPGYAPFTAYLHPDVVLPYDSAEVLYLLQIVGARMRDFLNRHKDQLRRLPMEMSVDLAAGGSLQLNVVSVARFDRGKLDRNLNAVPEGYKDKPVVGPPRPPQKAQPD